MRKFSKLHFLFSIQQGFTLIEMLAVISIFGIVSSMIVYILFVGLRGASKSQLLNTIRQNGNIAVVQMDRNVRFASELNTPATCVPSVIINPSTGFTVTSLSDGGQSTYNCQPVMGIMTIASNGASLINNDATTGFTVGTSCSITCTQPTSNDPPTIHFSFTLQQASTTNFAENKASVPFSTSITLQNANQGL